MISVNSRQSFPWVTNPMEIPATALETGTPASIKLNDPEQTLAILDEPFDSRISETMRTV